MPSAYGSWEEWRERRREYGGATVQYGGGSGQRYMPNDHPWKVTHVAQMWDPPPAPENNTIPTLDLARRIAGLDD